MVNSKAPGEGSVFFAARVSAHAFAHPAVWASVLLLLVNDHVLKGAFPSFWTGKLSDFAGLFFAPFLFIPLLALLLSPLHLPPARAADLGYGLVGAVFAAIKLSPTLNAYAAAWTSAVLGRSAAFALDPTDGIALLALVPSRWLWGRIARAAQGRRSPPPRLAWAGWSLAMLAFLATTPCPPIPMVYRAMVRDGRIYAGVGGRSEMVWVASADDGATWEWVKDPPPALRDQAPRLDWPIVRCLPDRPDLCYRIPGPGRIEKSADGGRTWSTAWAPPWGREEFRQRFLSGCSKPRIDEGPYDLAPDIEGERIRWIVAMGTEGIMILNPDGSWRLVGIEASAILSSGYRWQIHIVPAPYAAKDIQEAVNITTGEFLIIILPGASLSYSVLSLWRIRRLRAWLKPIRSVSPAFLLGACIGLGLGLLIFFIQLFIHYDDRTRGLIMLILIATLIANSHYICLFSICLIALGVALLKWWILHRTSPRPGIVWAAHGATLGVALGIGLGAWGFFIAWAMGWIPRYDMAAALALAWTIALWIVYFLWRPESMEMPLRIEDMTSKEIGGS